MSRIIFCGVVISGLLLAPEYSPNIASVSSYATFPFASLGKVNLFIVPTVTPGIKFISFIPPFINPIALLIVFSISVMTPLIPFFTAPEIASPILVPKAENVFLIPSQIPPKKLPILLKIFLILL